MVCPDPRIRCYYGLGLFYRRALYSFLLPAPEILAEMKTIFYNAFCLTILWLGLSHNAT